MLSSVAADLVQRPRNAGRLDNFTHYGECGSPGGGPYVSIWLEVEGDKIIRATYETHGCPSSIAASSMVCQLISGRSTDRAQLLTADDVRLILGGLPEGKGHLADMAVTALKSALTG